MKKMSVAEAAEFFGVSREAIHNRVRRGSLQTVVEDGIKYVVVDGTKQQPKRNSQPKTQPKQDDRYYKLLEEQNAKLQARVEKLEDETRSLRDQKEQLLIEERKKIESIYKEKDEQLKAVLNTLSQQFMLQAPQPQEDDAFEAEIEMQEVFEEKKEDGIISLKKYLKRESISKKKAQKIKNRFAKKASKDERVIEIDGKFYLDLVKYDYKGLL